MTLSGSILGGPAKKMYLTITMSFFKGASRISTFFFYIFTKISGYILPKLYVCIRVSSVFGRSCRLEGFAVKK